MTIDELKAYKRKAKAQRDNWKRKALSAEKETAERIAEYCLERRGFFASDFAAQHFAVVIRAGYWKATAPTQPAQKD